MPMPIPKPLVLGDIDLHYTTFAEAQVLPFTGKHQPSLVKSVARIVAAAKRKEASIVAGAYMQRASDREFGVSSRLPRKL